MGRPKLYTTATGDTYFIVRVNFYMHFDSMYCIENLGDCLMGSYYAPYRTTVIQPVRVDAETLCKTKYYYVNAYKFSVTSFMKRLASEESYWKEVEKEIVERYATQLNQKYNIKIEGQFPYTTEFCWKIEEEGNNS